MVIKFKYIQQGKQTQNLFRQRFNGNYGRGVLNKYILENIDQVRDITQLWMEDYNLYTPHNALSKLSPVKFAEIKCEFG